MLLAQRGLPVFRSCARCRGAHGLALLGGVGSVHTAMARSNRAVLSEADRPSMSRGTESVPTSSGPVPRFVEGGRAWQSMAANTSRTFAYQPAPTPQIGAEAVSYGIVRHRRRIVGEHGLARAGTMHSRASLAWCDQAGLLALRRAATTQLTWRSGAVSAMCFCIIGISRMRMWSARLVWKGMPSRATPSART